MAANTTNAFMGPAIAYDTIRQANADAANAAAAAAGSALLAEEQANRRLSQERAAHYETMRRLHGQMDVKDALKKALKEVAPDHPFVNPMDDNPELLKIAEKSKAEFNGTV